MTITVSQKWNGYKISLSGDKQSASSEYIIEGTTDEAVANSSLLAAVPSTYGGLALQEVKVTDRLSENAWEGEATWGNLEPATVGESSFEFDTGGGSQHISQSIATVNTYAPSGETAPDFQGAIGATSNGIDGVDITVPVYNFSETHWFADSAITTAYKLILHGLTGRKNAATFKGFAAGEVLFLGARGAKRGLDNWEISYKFAALPNATGLVVGDITGIAKAGWDHLWVRYQDYEDTAAKALVKRPVAVYIEQVYYDGDFSLLGI